MALTQTEKIVMLSSRFTNPLLAFADKNTLQNAPNAVFSTATPLSSAESPGLRKWRMRITAQPGVVHAGADGNAEHGDDKGTDDNACENADATLNKKSPEPVRAFSSGGKE